MEGCAGNRGGSQNAEKAVEMAERATCGRTELEKGEGRRNFLSLCV